MRALLLLSVLAACNGGGDTDETDTTDTDTNDTDTTPPEDPWSWCPTAADVVTPGGDAALASSGQFWCAMGDESFELADEPARKAQLLVVAGSYALPTATTEDAAFRLPVCTLFADGSHVDVDGDGTLSSWSQEYGDLTWWQWDYTQPMTKAGAPWSLRIDLDRQDPPSVTSPVVQLGADAMLPWGENFVAVSLVEGTYPSYDARRGFVPCAYANPPRVDTTHVEFDGGTADLVVNMGQSMASTEPAMFVRASGTLDGTAFDVSDYWQLVYNPEHHHIRRHFAVKFDAPIGEACALIVRDVYAYYSQDYGAPAIVEIADCDLRPIGAARAVTAQVTERVSNYGG